MLKTPTCIPCIACLAGYSVLRQPFFWIEVFAIMSVAAILEEKELTDNNHLPCVSRRTLLQGMW